MKGSWKQQHSEQALTSQKREVLSHPGLQTHRVCSPQTACGSVLTWHSHQCTPVNYLLLWEKEAAHLLLAESALLLRSSGTKQTLVKQRHKCSHVTSVLCLSKEKYLSLSLTLEALYMESFRLQASFQDFQFLVLHGFSPSYSAFPIEGVNPLLLTPKALLMFIFFPKF